MGRKITIYSMSRLICCSLGHNTHVLIQIFISPMYLKLTAKRRRRRRRRFIWLNRNFKNTAGGCKSITWSLTFFWNWTFTKWGCAPSDLRITQKRRKWSFRFQILGRGRKRELLKEVEFTANRSRGCHREEKRHHFRACRSSHSKLPSSPSLSGHRSPRERDCPLSASLLPPPPMTQSPW